jgi:GDP-mannose 6-dehydrogenase
MPARAEPKAPRVILVFVPAESKVAVFGLGYVGCVTSACLADLGHHVVGVDLDALKVRSVESGRAPFYEPGLEELVRKNVSAGRLSASTDANAALEASEIAMLCVGTPSEKNGNLSLDQLSRVAAQIGAHLATRSRPLSVAVRSTVFPGTCEQVVQPLLGNSSHSRIVANPEFLREGNAVRDFLEPTLIVVGGDDTDAVRQVADLYAPLGVETSLVSLRTAEMIKYACNCFHALKIAFANETGALCDALGISAHEVMDTLCRDVTLNISRAYLRPGFAFGGSCLPKDLRALVYRAGRLDLNLPLLESVLPSNDRHLERAIERVQDLAAERVGVFGLAFKENTDDVRESPVVRLLEHLIGKGRNLRVFDPHIRLDQIYGSNERYLLATIPHIGRLMVSSLDELLEGSECVVIAQKPADELWSRIRASGLPVLDLVKMQKC